MMSTNNADSAQDGTLGILHLEDSATDHQLVLRTLSKAGLPCHVTRVETLEEFQEAIAQNHYQLVLADYRLGTFTAIDAWNAASKAHQNTPFIILSGAIGEAAAVEAIQCGISDYLHKDSIAALPRVIQRTLELQTIKDAKTRADQELILSEKRVSELAGHLQTAIENERAAIAREVHDDIGGALTAVRLDLAWLARHSREAPMLEHIASASQMVQHAAQASQRIMRDLRPAILDQGLVPSIQWLARNFEQRMACKLDVNAPTEDFTLPTDVMLTAYRTAQEALTNITKYAEGSHVRIDVSHLGGALTLEIADNGPGLDKAALRKPSSYGLRGLAERAKSVGGWLDISTMPGSGTTITLSVPLHQEPDTKTEAP